MKDQQKDVTDLNFFEELQLPLSLMIDMEVHDLGDKINFDDVDSPSSQTFEIANETKCNGFDSLDREEQSRTTIFLNGHISEQKQEVPFEPQSNSQKEEDSPQNIEDNNFSTAKKDILRNFLPTLKRCIIRSIQQHLSESDLDEDLLEFLQPKKTVTLNLIDKLFAKGFLLNPFSKMFDYRKLKREFQISRVLPKNRKCFHHQILRIKKSFIVGKLSCL